MTRPCRCLVGEMPGEAELAGIIRERVEGIPEEDRAPAEEYALRLSACRECGSLNRGTCALCGCYVEIRAAKAHMHCAAVPARW